MSAQPSSSRAGGSSANIGNMFTFASYIKLSTAKPLNDCILALRESPRQATWLGGYNIRLRFPKGKANSPDVVFEIEYFRQRERSSRSSHLAQRLRGVFYRKDNHTYVIAKASFTLIEVLWFWVAVALTLVSVGLLIYTRSVAMWIFIAMGVTFLLGMSGFLWLNRFYLTRIVRLCMSEPVTKAETTK